MTGTKYLKILHGTVINGVQDRLSPFRGGLLEIIGAGWGGGGVGGWVVKKFWCKNFFNKPGCLQESFSRAYNSLFLGITACKIFFRHVSLAGIFCGGTVSPPPVISSGPSLLLCQRPICKTGSNDVYFKGPCVMSFERIFKRCKYM